MPYFFVAYASGSKRVATDETNGDGSSVAANMMDMAGMANPIATLGGDNSMYKLLRNINFLITRSNKKIKMHLFNGLQECHRVWLACRVDHRWAVQVDPLPISSLKLLMCPTTALVLVSHVSLQTASKMHELHSLRYNTISYCLDLFRAYHISIFPPVK